MTLALAATHGHFDDQGAGTRWFANDGAEFFRVTLMPQKGVMPEADFFYPFPYEPLRHLTRDAVEAEIACGADGLLDRMFQRLIAELETADPDYCAAIGARELTVETFGAA